MTDNMIGREADALALGAALGRKFEPTDISDYPWLRRVATDYALSAVEAQDNAFMADMYRAAQSRWGLSNGQAKGVLNFMLARRRPRADAGQGPALPNVKDVPSARYRVVQDDGTSTAIRLDSAAWATDKPKGTRCIAIRTADGWLNLGFVDPDGSIGLWRKGQPFVARLAPALQTVSAGVSDGSWLIYALSYAQEGGECAFCGLELDNEASLTVGYGPTCAKKRGLPWGAKAEPMAVVLARAAGATAPAVTPTPTQEVAAPATKRSYEDIFGPDEEPPAPSTPATSLLALARQIEQG